MFKKAREIGETVRALVTGGSITREEEPLREANETRRSVTFIIERLDYSASVGLWGQWGREEFGLPSEAEQAYEEATESFSEGHFRLIRRTTVDTLLIRTVRPQRRIS